MSLNDELKALKALAEAGPRTHKVERALTIGEHIADLKRQLRARARAGCSTLTYSFHDDCLQATPGLEAAIRGFVKDEQLQAKVKLCVEEERWDECWREPIPISRSLVVEISW